LDGLRPEELFPHDQDHYGCDGCLLRGRSRTGLQIRSCSLQLGAHP
jgi:hypothetical protein